MSEMKYKLDMLKKPTWKFVNASDFAKNNLLYIQESGKFCSGKDYFTRRIGLDSYLIKATISGKGVLEYCGEKYSVAPKTVMFIDCKEYQNYYTDPGTGKWEMLWVHLSGNTVKPYYEKFLEKSNGSNVAMLSDNNNVCEIIDNIITVSANYTKEHDSDIIADRLLHSLLGLRSFTRTALPSLVGKLPFFTSFTCGVRRISSFRARWISFIIFCISG